MVVQYWNMINTTELGAKSLRLQILCSVCFTAIKHIGKKVKLHRSKYMHIVKSFDVHLSELTESLYLLLIGRGHLSFKKLLCLKYLF